MSISECNVLKVLNLWNVPFQRINDYRASFDGYYITVAFKVEMPYIIIVTVVS